MGDPAAPNASETTGEMLQAFTKYLPSLMQTINAQMLPNEQAQLAASKVISPEYSNLQADILDTSGRRLNEIGSSIERENALRAAQKEADVLRGPGRDVVEAGLDISKLADPEFFRTRENTSAAINSLLGGELTGGELSSIERGLNQQGGQPSINTGTNAIKAGLQYGNAAGDKLRQAIAQATAYLPASLSGVDPFLQATGRSGVTNLGDTKFTGARQNAGQQSAAISGQFLGETGANARQTNEINANRTTAFDRGVQAVAAISNFAPGAKK